MPSAKLNFLCFQKMEARSKSEGCYNFGKDLDEFVYQTMVTTILRTIPMSPIALEPAKGNRPYRC